MDLTLVLGSAAVVFAMLVLWWSVSGARAPQPVQLATVPDMRRRTLDADATERAVPMLERLGQRLRRRQSGERSTRLARKIRRAGSPDGWTVERVLAAKLLAAVGFGGLLALRFLVSPSVFGVFLVVGAALFGYFLPEGLLDSKVTRRQEAIRSEISEVVDQLAVMVHAGLSIDAALVRSAQSGSGPMAEELSRVVQEMRVGVSRATALRNMSDRVDVSELSGFVAALSQADQLGVPVSDTLRVQAVEMRGKQRQAAEEQAMKLPVKILFPMVVCILPVIFIVLLGPAALRIIDQFSR